MLIIQNEVIKSLLATESVTVIGLMLAVCGLLIYDRLRQEKRNKELFTLLEKERSENIERFDKERKDNNEALLEIAVKYNETSNLVLNELKTFRDVYLKTR